MIFHDFKELLSEFNAHEVKYLIVGDYAVSLHGHPRATKDLDILIGPDPDNFFRMGTPPVMVDILPRISGIDFDAAWRHRVTFEVDDTLTVPFISRRRPRAVISTGALARSTYLAWAAHRTPLA